ncbi:MAG: hypothetical protein JO327_03945 [Nitrososphaeraceae archaeon]|nr:hypothetical protein [Nitrososphaeraceae archaeon]
MSKVWLVGTGIILACAVLLSVLGNVYHPSSNNGIAGASDTISSTEADHHHPDKEQEDQHHLDQQHYPEIREAIKAPI